MICNFHDTLVLHMNLVINKYEQSAYLENSPPPKWMDMFIFYVSSALLLNAVIFEIIAVA